MEFRHQKITTPTPTPEDRLMHSIQQLTAVLKGDGVSASDAQMKAIQKLQETLINWSEEDNQETQKEEPKGLKEQPSQARRLPRVKRPSRPKMARAPRVQRRPLSRPEPTVQPVAHRTRSRTAKHKQSRPPEVEPVAHRTRSRTKPSEVIAAVVRDLLACSVMDVDTGKMLEFRQLRKHPKYKKFGILHMQMT